MSVSNRQTQGEQAVPVRWYERGWSFALDESPPSPANPGTPRSRRNRVLTVAAPRIPVTTSKRFSQPSRTPRQRRPLP